MEARTPHRKTRVGEVVSNKMDKTISVKVVRHAIHPLYSKRIITAKKFLAHDEENDCRVGDTVMIAESRPLSKNKCWSVVKIVKRAPVLGAPKEEA